jgi:hypothetical protein
MIIFVGDLHCKEESPYRESCISFLNWLYDNYGDATILHGGDLFDSSSHHHDLVHEVVTIVSKFKDFRIITGNHDRSGRLGNIIKPFSNYKNITVYEKKEEVSIEGIDFLILPYRKADLPEYSSIEGVWDYSLSHITPIQEAFGDEGTELRFKARVAHVFAHIHRYRKYVDNFGNNCLIAGSVVNTRYGEQDWEKNIYVIQKHEYIRVPVPQTFTYETIEFGSFPINPSNILNIVNAPDKNSVFNVYKNYHIRESGIEIKGETSGIVGENINFDKSSIIQSYIEFCSLEAVSDNLKNLGIEYLSNYLEIDHTKEV